MRTGTVGMIGALALSAGCVSASAVSAQRLHESSMRSVQYRAAWDLDCPDTEVEVRCIDMTPHALERGAMCIAAGARGCGRRASYRSVVVTELGRNRSLVTWALEGMWSAEPDTCSHEHAAGVLP